MSYETGTATSQHDLLDKVRAFLLAESWSVNGWADVGSGKRLHVSKGGYYFNFRSAAAETACAAYYAATGNRLVTGIALNGSTGYDGGLAWDVQPGGPISVTNSRSWGVCINEVSGAIPAYHLFTLGDNSVCLAVEYQAGKFQWLVWGELDKTGAGAWTGGAFFAGSRSPALASFSTIQGRFAGPFGYWGDYYGFTLIGVYVDADSVSEKWWGAKRTDHTSYSARQAHPHGLAGFDPNGSNTYPLTPTATDHLGLLSPLIRSTPNSFNGLTPLFPIYFAGERASSRFSFLGQVPNMRLCNITGCLAGDEITIGADVWQVFPAHSQADTQNNLVGCAVLKVT